MHYDLGSHWPDVLCIGVVGCRAVCCGMQPLQHTSLPALKKIKQYVVKQHRHPEGLGLAAVFGGH